MRCGRALCVGSIEGGEIRGSEWSGSEFIVRDILRVAVD